MRKLSVPVYVFFVNFLRVKWWTFVVVFEKFSMKNWQVVAVVEIANLQRPRKKITVEYLAWFMENILGSRLRGITVWKHVRAREVKYRTHIEAGFEVNAD